MRTKKTTKRSLWSRLLSVSCSLSFYPYLFGKCARFQLTIFSCWRATSIYALQRFVASLAVFYSLSPGIKMKAIPLTQSCIIKLSLKCLMRYLSSFRSTLICLWCSLFFSQHTVCIWSCGRCLAYSKMKQIHSALLNLNKRRKKILLKKKMAH